MKVLWLTSWFPNRTSPTNGDFTERHAAAVAPFVQQLFIIHVVKDDTLPAGSTEIVQQQQQNILLYTVYYGPGKYSALFEKIYSYHKYLALQRRVFKQIMTEFGRPDLVHVHVAMKAGLFARELKKKYRIPYIVTEHSTVYYPHSHPSLYTSGRIYRQMNVAVLRRAALLLPVSRDLGNTICRNFVQQDVLVIPNVVDTKLFYYKPVPAATFRFVHVSYLNYQKNPEGIIAACSLLKQKGYKFEITFAGKADEVLKTAAYTAGLTSDMVHFKPALPYNEVAALMQGAHAFVLFSRFENLPCVLLEAQCCGLPVISTNVGGIHEVVHPENGILVENENVQQLAAAMQQMIDNYSNYNREMIAAAASSKFNYNVVGRQHLPAYETVMHQL
ncbi:MAG TPA: glycosyltransferase [Ferruginibacter sp.]|mgnify:CR=1 FL=1|nr:glycosyltransferase [Ferruginibacter sp.]HMP21278.1 glycosyltransferase [Ferruginibacter sp.]